ncbi:J domain-containing protein [Pseudarthrobacter albicanus]|uniref:J domain-containing protein n=1 Tax=Pseudarthrobacter albicanus TaxID=2823873 RepID=UPI001BAB5DD1|nr:J domain-containing protein [Pseudarthrobacter albicanus]
MHADSRGYYAALEVAPDATQQEISRAFRALMRQRHPDVGNPGGGDEVRSILEAFAVLRDPRSRAAYDRGQGPADRPRNAAHPPRDIPVRHIRHPEPLLRVTPVRWERGPWRGP